MRKGNSQLFFLGWNADYPDPENFLFLLYGPNSRAKTAGENASNYSNPDYDRLFERVKSMPNSPERASLIVQMTDLVQQDVPWLFAFYPKQFGLIHEWLGNVSPDTLIRNNIKYQKINTGQRKQSRQAWNQPVWWPVPLLVLLVGLFMWPAWASYKRREQAKGVREDLSAALPETSGKTP